MDFGQALAELKAGNTVTRPGWNGRGMWVALSPGYTLPADRVFTTAIADEISDGTGVFRPHLMMRTADGDFVPWVASHSDLLADDWATAPAES